MVISDHNGTIIIMVVPQSYYCCKNSDYFDIVHYYDVHMVM